MAISSEIEKLERRWNENPSGLMFAPLAEAYRRAGNHARALEILEHGLRVHPDYVPALIVRGRCHLETGGMEDALLAFDQALTHDPVNPIALRGLAEVHERSGRLREAVERLELLVEVDRGNDEGRGALDRVRAQLNALELPQAPAVPAVPVVSAEAALPAAGAAPEERPAEEPGAESGESLAGILLVEPEEPPAEILLDAAGASAAVLEVENLSVDPMEAAEPPVAPVPWVWEPPVALPAVEPPVAETAEPPTESAAEAPEPPAVAGEPEPSVETEVPPISVAPPEPVMWTPAPLLQPAEAEASVEAPPLEPELAEPAISSEPPAMVTSDATPLPAEPAPPESPEAAAVEWPSVEPVAEGTDAPAAEADVEDEPVPVAGSVPGLDEPTAAAEPAAPPEEPELIVTESMAEVFLRQGHAALALAVYRQLAERSPDDESIRAAIRRLEGEVIPVPAESAPEHPAYRAAESGGRSVGDLLRSVLQAPPPASSPTVLPPAIEPAGEPARPGGEPLSLGAVFGDEPVAPPPASPDAGAPAEPSYDEFFGSVPTADVGAPAATRAPEEDDLRQFNDWLRGLKR